MKKIYLFGLLLCMVFGSVALTACGGDDNESTPPTPPTPPLPTSIIGNWVGEWPANPNDPNQLLWRYAHKIQYEIKQDGTFDIKTCACYYSTDPSDAQYDKPSMPALDPTRPAGAYLIERIAFRCYGTYTLDNGKISLNVTHEGYMNGQTGSFDTPANATSHVEIYNYSITNGKLKINDGSPVQINPHQMIAYSEMNYVQ